MRIIGIDPGLNFCGVACVDYDKDNRERKPVFYKVIKVPNLSGYKSNLKEDAKMVRRLRDLFLEIDKIIKELKPDSIGIEDYKYIPGKGKSYRKTIGAIDAAIYCAIANGYLPFMFSSFELRRIVLGKKSGDKKEIQNAIIDIYDGESFLLKEADKEHVFDSFAIAEAVIRDAEEMARMVGWDG